MAKIIEVILSEERRGKGVEGDPIRLCPQLWTKEGVLIAEYDPHEARLWGKFGIVDAGGVVT